MKKRWWEDKEGGAPQRETFGEEEVKFKSEMVVVVGGG